MIRRHYQLLLATVAYADVFDYPLTTTEAVLWHIGSTRPARLPVRGVEQVGEYLVLSGRRRIIALRKERQRVAAMKWHHIRNIGTLFSFIPTVTLIGVTGGLAVDNVRRSDDIDIFFITRPGTLWITRMCVTLLAEVIRVRRRPGEHMVSDKVCLNMFMAENALTLPTVERDLFAAHEVLQMVPLWERGDTYTKFLKANSWVREYVPNIWREKTHELKIKKHKEFKMVFFSLIRATGTVILSVLEPLARFIQLRYMEKRRTNEVIRRGQIRFHPRDAREWVREKYAKRLAIWDIPLDNIFYHP